MIRNPLSEISGHLFERKFTGDKRIVRNSVMSNHVLGELAGEKKDYAQLAFAFEASALITRRREA